jgi:hypothetical protein
MLGIRCVRNSLFVMCAMACVMLVVARASAISMLDGAGVSFSNVRVKK